MKCITTKNAYTANETTYYITGKTEYPDGTQFNRAAVVAEIQRRTSYMLRVAELLNELDLFGSAVIYYSDKGDIEVISKRRYDEVEKQIDQWTKHNPQEIDH